VVRGVLVWRRYGVPAAGSVVVGGGGRSIYCHRLELRVRLGGSFETHVGVSGGMGRCSEPQLFGRFRRPATQSERQLVDETL
jgi:hypothetical protein